MSKKLLSSDVIQPSKDFNAKADFMANLFSDAQVVNGVITINNSNISMNTETNTPLWGTYFFFRTNENVTNPKLSVNGSAPAALVVQHAGNPPESEGGPRENLDLVTAYSLYEVIYMNGLWRVLNVPAKISGSDIKPNTITSDNLQWATLKDILELADVCIVLQNKPDFNSLVCPNRCGFFILRANNGAISNNPTNTTSTTEHWYLFQMQYKLNSNEYCWQLAKSVNGSDGHFLWYRTRSAKNWTAWQKVAKG